MDGFRKWMSFNKGERIAIVSLSLCIIGLVIAVLLHRPHPSFDGASLHDLDSLLALRQVAMEQQRQKPMPTAQEKPVSQRVAFNPNTMTEEEGLQAGLSPSQVRNIINYREKGGKFYSKQDFAKLYTISEEDFALLEPYILLPEIAQKKQHKPKTETKRMPKEGKGTPQAIPTVDLNTADSAALVALPQIGPYTAARIVAYREKLGGFIDIAQLLELRDMDEARYKAAAPYINIGVPSIRKIDVNRDDFKTMVSHPYLNYDQVRRIINQREKRGMIKDWEQLKALIAQDEPVNPLLEMYVAF